VKPPPTSSTCSGIIGMVFFIGDFWKIFTCNEFSSLLLSPIITCTRLPCRRRRRRRHRHGGAILLYYSD